MRSSRGSVTAETAVVLPALMVMLAAALWMLAAAGARIECIDAARAGARAAARGEAPEAVRSMTRRVAPEGAQVVLRRTGEMVRVSVRADVRPVGSVATGLPTLSVEGSATADIEGR